MTEEKLNTTDMAETLRLSIDNEKSALERVRTELSGASKDVLKSYKKYSLAKDKAGEKKSARNLSRLSKAEAKLDEHIEDYTTARKKLRDALSSVIAAHEKYLDEVLFAHKGAAKKSARAMDKYVYKIERFIEKTDESIACVSSYHQLSIDSDSEMEKSNALSQNSAPVAKNYAPTTSFVHTNEVSVSPVSIDIGPIVEKAVERVISEFTDALGKRIAETINALEIPVVDSGDAAALAAIRATLDDLIKKVDSIIPSTEEKSEECRETVDTQCDAIVEAPQIEETVEPEEIEPQDNNELTEEQSAPVDSADENNENQETTLPPVEESPVAEEEIAEDNSKCVEEPSEETTINTEEQTNG